MRKTVRNNIKEKLQTYLTKHQEELKQIFNENQTTKNEARQ
jgi:hypothetical protein